MSGFDLFIVLLVAGLAGLAIWLLRSTADWRAYLSDEDRSPSETPPDDPPAAVTPPGALHAWNRLS